MDQRSKRGAVPGLEVPQLAEQSPLIDPRKLRSCRSSPASRSQVCRSEYAVPRAAQRAPAKGSSSVYSLKTISELGQAKGVPEWGLDRTRSVPLSSQYLTPHPTHIRSPQYRVNPIVKFSDRPFPERMNYGIAGYNTARPRSFTSGSEPSSRPRSFTSGSEASRRPRSFTSVPETMSSRPRSFTGIPECPVGRETPATRSILWRAWTRRFRDKMGRVRVRDTCSRLLSRFRGGHL